MIVNPPFVYRGNRGPTQTWLEFEPRSETNRTLILLPRTGTAIFHFSFPDASPSDSVTPRFMLRDAEFLMDGTVADGSSEHQLYLLGHGQVVPRVLHITGQTVGVGPGTERTYDLQVDLIDPLLAEGITGNTTFRPSQLLVEMLHGGSNPITYSCTILVGV
jgi:hypothetical protein